MDVSLAYGTDGLTVAVPDDALVVTPSDLPGLPDEAGAIRAALATPVSGPPLADSVRPGMTVAVVFPDLTRPMPNKTVLPPILAELERLGVRREDITLCCSTGTHRLATRDEMAGLIGEDLLDGYRVYDHDCNAPDEHVTVGEVDGQPVRIAKAYVEADIRIATGFVEPHFFAGFSGGPKAVCPGLADLDTVLEAHSPARIADRRATWTVLDGNPVHEFVRQATALVPPTMVVDVAINAARDLTAVFAGTLPDSHRAACAFVQGTAVQDVGPAYDVVITTNAGHPLDRNLYQATKGMAAAERVVREGGVIISAVECMDGLPDVGAFADVLRTAATPADLLTVASAHDQWSVQVLGRVLARARVMVYSDGLTDDMARVAHVEPVNDFPSALADAMRAAGPRVCVLPLGPLTVATPA